MLLVGVFSTHITYIILALVYIFGYGTYALNYKKNQSEEIDSQKTIFVNLDDKSIDTSKDFHFEDCKECIKSCSIQKKEQYHVLNPKRQKFKIIDTLNWTKYNSSLPNITRPSPIFA
ncbi:hypothetical protein E9993_15015 [Labilibacter sediminis]|nr:hypothetical protein E9993_15015 [Labilibacter sediminis]